MVCMKILSQNKPQLRCLWIVQNNNDMDENKDKYVEIVIMKIGQLKYYSKYD